MPTIVEYSNAKRPLNAYPARIISPPAPAACCEGDMVRISEVHAEGEGKFFYQRCPTCGFTVRRFLPVPRGIDLATLVSLEDREDRQLAG